MYRKKRCIAMLLAGGRGSRLKVLTENTAKPAVEFGGKYRIIDFALSNCINSGIDTVGVLTQYQPLALNEYIGNGLPWDLDRLYGGVTILPPYRSSDVSESVGDWYKGTANAIYQNLNFIDRYSPERVVVLSADHVYKMDYSKMISFHDMSGADCTIATVEVSDDEASRFGIVEVDAEGRVLGFEEKPEVPKSTKVSMGIYVFNTDILVDALKKDAASTVSENDFGKDIIPALLMSGAAIYAYGFSGYWKDVGTLESLWQANMDMLGEKPLLALEDDEWRIYSRHRSISPQYMGSTSDIVNSVVTEGCEIYGTVRSSVLGPNVTVMKGATVYDSVIFDSVVIKEGAEVNYSVISSGSVIGEGARVGEVMEKAIGLCVLGANYEVPKGRHIPDNSVLSDGAREEVLI